MQNEHREAVIYYLRSVAGLTYRRIAPAVGLHHTNVCRHYHRLSDEDKARLVARVRGEDERPQA